MDNPWSDKWAALCWRADKVFGLVTEHLDICVEGWCELEEHQKTRIFNTYEEALKWCNGYKHPYADYTPVQIP